MNCTRLALPTLFVFAGCSTNVDGPNGPPEVFENASALVHEREIRASIDGVTAEITIPVVKKRGPILEGELSLRLIDVSDAKEAELATATLEFAQKTDSQTHRIRLSGLPANITRPNTAPPSAPGPGGDP